MDMCDKSIGFSEYSILHVRLPFYRNTLLFKSNVVRTKSKIYALARWSPNISQELILQKIIHALRPNRSSLESFLLRTFGLFSINIVSMASNLVFYSMKCSIKKKKFAVSLIYQKTNSKRQLTVFCFL